MNYKILIKTSRGRKQYEDNDFQTNGDINGPYKLVYFPPIVKDSITTDFFQTGSFDSFLDELIRQISYLEKSGDTVSVLWGMKEYSKKSMNVSKEETREMKLERILRESFQDSFKGSRKRKKINK